MFFLTAILACIPNEDSKSPALADTQPEDSVDIDADGDGYPASTDCMDTAAVVNPHAKDVCNGYDDDCDGGVDNDPEYWPTWYPDADGDGFGAQSGALDACEAPAGYLGTDRDCDDADPAINPDAVDVPEDGIDKDCSGADTTLPLDCDEVHGQIDSVSITAATTPDQLESICAAGPVSVKDGITVKGTTLTDLFPLWCVCAYSSAPLTLRDNSNLTSLHGLESISGASDTRIENNALPDLVGLASLADAGNFSIVDNPNLVSLTGLEAVVEVETLEISGNSALESLTGLDSLGVAVSVEIAQNPLLPSLAGLGGLTEVDSDFEVKESAALESMAGLDSLSTVGSTLLVDNNVRLRSLVGLGALLYVESLELGDNPELTSLAGLDALAHAGTLFVDGSSLETLAGMPALVDVGALKVRGNTTLRDLSGFPAGAEVGDLSVQTSAVVSLDGLEAVVSLGSVSLYDNDALADLSALANVTSLSGDLSISRCDALQSIGLSSLQSVAGSVSLSSLAALPDLTGLDRLQAIKSLSITSNPVLESLDGLGGLQSVEDDLWIEDCQALTDVSGLSGGADVGRTFFLNNNDALPDLEGLFFGDVGQFHLKDNDAMTHGSSTPVARSLGGLDIDFGDNLASIEGIGPMADGADVAIWGSALADLPDLGATRLGSLTVYYTYALTELSCLAGLEELDGSLTISLNTGLESLSGPSALDRVDGDIRITDNEPLTDIGAKVLTTSITYIGGTVTVSGNGSP